MRVQMLGLCRFSYVGLRGYRVDHATVEERRAFLYDPQRLRRRWFWFRHVALPAWRAQTDPDFTLVVLTGPDLPEPYLSRLLQLQDKIPQLRVALVPPMERHLEACMAALEPHIDRQADVVGHFRHDDDDAVAVDYIARTRADFALSRGLWERDGILCIDNMRGLMVNVGPAGVEITPRMCYNIGVAQTIFLPPDRDRTAVHFEHWKVGLWMPGVAIGQPLMFLRLTHGDNDSGEAGLGFPWQADPALYKEWLRSRFRVDMDRLAEGARRFS